MIPQSHALNLYLTGFFKVEKDHSNKYKTPQNKELHIFTDESLDKKGRYLCSIIVAVNSPDGISQTLVLAKTVFESEPLNRTIVSQQVISTCPNLALPFDNIRSFTTDNASYLKAAWNNLLKAVFPNAVHMICISHTMNIVIRDFIDLFEQITG